MSESLEELLHAQLQEALSAEIQQVRGLPQLIDATDCPELKAAFQAHLEETQGQVERLKQACREVGCPAAFETCQAMQGLIAQALEIAQMEVEEPVRDAALIIAAQKIEHYEIALYGGLCALAAQMGRNDVATLLHATLDEEKEADQKLTEIAETRINAKAASA